MLRDKKDTQENLKDSERSLKGKTYGTSAIMSISYTRTNKLITALYMVTDIMDTEEPIRPKLRKLGLDILSDIQTTPPHALGKILQILSFLDISLTVNLISEMNAGILKKEFLALKESIKESTQVFQNFNGQANLSEFFKDELSTIAGSLGDKGHQEHKGQKSIGHQMYQGHSARIGVQTGDTLMKALSGVEMSNRGNFNLLKTKRREEIIRIIKDLPAGEAGKNKEVSIKDIVFTLRNDGVDRGEKTLQRELVSMVKDNILKKTGSKRWSRYSLLLL